MSKSSKTIVQDLLKAASYYWHDENQDQVKPLNPDEYDPVVDKLFKANALELEKLYAEIEESHQEIILNLAQALVPDESLLPEPGYTVVQINPKVSRIYTSPDHQYQITGQSDTGEKHEYYFSPLFEHEYPSCYLKAIITDNIALLVNNNQTEIVNEITGTKASSTIWLGLDIGKVKEKDSLTFFLGNKIVDEFDKDYFLFNRGKWLLNGQTEKELTVKQGIENFPLNESSQYYASLLNTLKVPNTHEQRIFSRLKKSFIHVTIPEEINLTKREFPPELESKDLVSEIEIKEALCWIKIELPVAVTNHFLVNHVLYTNCIPLVNRRLKSKNVQKSNYDRILLPMPTNDYFLDVHQVQDAKNKQEDTKYQQVDLLHPDNKPGTFVLRSGSRVRRLNREDATGKIHRLLEVIQDEYSTFKEEGVSRLREDFNIIEKSINRIKKNLPKYFRDDTVYASFFCIANFRPGANRLYYQYWETQGDLVKQLGEKIGLSVTSNDVTIADSRSIIPIQHGKGVLSDEDYINQLKISLLSRGRIITKGDIELFCKSRFRGILLLNKVGRELMMLENGQRGRGIVVTVDLIANLSKEEAELVRIELQNDLNAKSAFFTQIKVRFSDAA